MKPKFAVLIPWIVFASTSPLLAVQGDRDNDGLRDEAETNTGLYLSPTDTGTNPDRSDTDGDSVPDGLEVTKGTDPTSAASRLSRPNIILINCDDLGYGDVGCFWQNQRTGTQKFATPGLDSLAAEGMMLTHHYAGAPVCASSRASLLQGRHQGHADIRDSQFDYALPNNHSLASVLQTAGYHTVHVGKAGLAGNIASNAPSGAGLPAHPLYRGFDRFFGYWSHYQGHEHYPRNSTTEKGAFILDDFQKILNANIDLYTTDAWTAFAKKTIVEDTQNTPNRPFFLYLAYDAPHFKNQVPPTRDYPAGKGLNGGIRWTGAPAYASTATNDPAKVDNIENQHSSVNPAWPDVQRRYVSMIRRIDDSVADIIQTLRDLHIDDNTLVVFTSDNGPTIEEGQDPRFFRSFANLEGVKRDIWEGGIREPTIVWWPGRVPASNQLSNIRASGLPSAHWDWLPTFAEIAGAPAPSYTDGISLVPTLTGTGVQRQRDYLYFEFNSPGGYTIALPEFPNHGWDPQNQSQAIRIGDLMGVRVNIASPNDSFRIYNVVNDPGQSVNLAGSRPDLQQKMKDIAVSGRRPLAGASRPYDTAALPAVSPGAVTNGIRFASFEGYWPWLPEFRDMTAVGSGITARPDPAVRSRDRDIGLAFTGYLSVPTTGSYAFTLSSDSGANLWIHDSHVIDNDFNRAAARSSGPVYLSAGLHPIRLYYRHQGGPASLDLSYSGPGISLQAVPASAYFTEGPAPVIQLNPDDFVISRNGDRIVDVFANDVSNYPLTLTSVGATPSGTASISAGKISFQAANGFWGSSTFPYTATGGATGATSTIRADVLYDNEIWIPLDEGAGTSVRTVAGTTSPGGTLNGSGNPAAAWIPGRSGHAMRFDGIDDEVDFPALDLPSGSSPRSFSFWIRTSARSTDELQTMFSYGANIPGQRLSIRLDNIPGIATDQPLRLEVEGGRVVGTRTLNDGFWHHIACVLSDRNNDGILDVGETLLYVDGSPDTVSNSASLPMTTSSGSTPCLGGSNHSPGYNFKGDIDDVRIFPRALESSEIAELRSSTGSFIGTQDDSDGDGALDYQEALAGTDPYDGRSVFRINAAASVLRGPVITLHWPAVAGKTYQAEESADLKSWTPVPDVPSYHASADVSDAILNIPANGSARRFFRLSAR